MKHTQGEWHSHKAISRMYNKETFEVYRPKEGDTIGYTFNEANAKLIAAAPDLLENLTRLLDRINENDLWNMFPSACERAEAAIKKATT